MEFMSQQKCSSRKENVYSQHGRFQMAFAKEMQKIENKTKQNKNWETKKGNFTMSHSFKDGFYSLRFALFCNFRRRILCFVESENKKKTAK